MHIKYCEDCSKWEPIPFHNDGGMCLVRAGTPVHAISDLDSADRPAKAPPGGMKLALGF